MRLSVVMPVYNEEGCIETVVRSVGREILDQVESSELVVVDDCSTDGTAQVLDRLAREDPRLRILRQEVNGGHGRAIRRGFDEAGGDFVFHLDSDNQFRPDEFCRLWALRGDADLVLGVRAQRHDPLHRLIISRTVRALDFVLFGKVLSDANVPFKLVRSTALRRILALIPPDAFAPSIMIAVVAAYLGMRIEEVPVTHLPRTTGQCSIMRWKLAKVCLLCAWQMLELAVRVRFSRRQD